MASAILTMSSAALYSVCKHQADSVMRWHIFKDTGARLCGGRHDDPDIRVFRGYGVDIKTGPKGTKEYACAIAQGLLAAAAESERTANSVDFKAAVDAVRAGLPSEAKVFKTVAEMDKDTLTHMLVVGNCRYELLEKWPEVCLYDPSDSLAIMLCTALGSTEWPGLDLIDSAGSTKVAMWLFFYRLNQAIGMVFLELTPRPTCRQDTMYFNWQVGTTRVIDMMLDIAKDESAKAKQQEE